MLYENSSIQLETSESPFGGTTIPKPQRYKSSTMDVNAPPIPQQGSQSFDYSNIKQQPQTMWEPADEEPKSYKKTSIMKSSSENGSGNYFSLFSWNQRFDEEVPSKSLKKTKKAKKHTASASQRLHPIPVINENDDRVPQAVAGAVLHAADALLCRESVIDYVINATDLRDECDGLKKAYTKNCGGEDEEKKAVARRRRVKETQQTRPVANPVIQWQQWLHRQMQSIRKSGIWGSHHHRTVFLMEDEILNEWEEASYEVGQGWDLYNNHEMDSIFFEDHFQNSASSAQRRRMNEADAFERAEQRLEKKETAARTAEEAVAAENTNAAPPPLAPPLPPANKTVAINKERPKLSNLALPTSKHHVSEKMISETLLLSQQEDRLVAQVKAATNNVTANAVADAAKSAKAVSDTYDFVSSVLNDPNSVEARTCCASILNVFHENCYVDEDEEFSDGRLFIVVAVIALCGLVKSLIRHFQIRWLPEAAGCILVGGTLYPCGFKLTEMPYTLSFLTSLRLSSRFGLGALLLSASRSEF